MEIVKICKQLRDSGLLEAPFPKRCRYGSTGIPSSSSLSSSSSLLTSSTYVVGFEDTVVCDVVSSSSSSPVNVLDLPVEVLCGIYGYMNLEDVLRFGCSGHLAHESTCSFLHHVVNLLVVFKNLSDIRLLSLIDKLDQIRILNIICGKQTPDGSMVLSHSNKGRLSFDAVHVLMERLPPSALVDINYGNFYMGNPHNLETLVRQDPKLLNHIANLHLRPGLTKDMVARVLCHCGNLRGLTLDQCLVDVSLCQDTISFPWMKYLTFRGVSFTSSSSPSSAAYHHHQQQHSNNNTRISSMNTIISACGPTLHSFEMTDCIGFRDAELDALTSQQCLEILTLKQQCSLSDKFVKFTKWNNLRILTLDSVHPASRVSFIIRSAPCLTEMELNNIVSDSVFVDLSKSFFQNSAMKKITLCNYVGPEVTREGELTDAGLNYITTAFPRVEYISLHHFEYVSKLSCIHLSFLTQLNLEYVCMTLSDVELIISDCPVLLKCFCIAIRAQPFPSINRIQITSKSLQSICFRDCTVDHVIISDCPQLRRFGLSFLRNDVINFSMKGNCNSMKCIEMKAVETKVVDSIIQSVIRYIHEMDDVFVPNSMIKWIKFKCSRCAASPSQVLSVFHQFKGHVLNVYHPLPKTVYTPLKDIIGLIKTATERARPVNDGGDDDNNNNNVHVDDVYETKTREMTSDRNTYDKANIQRILLQNNIYLEANFPLRSFVLRNDDMPDLHHRCIVMISNLPCPSDNDNDEDDE